MAVDNDPNTVERHRPDPVPGTMASAPFSIRDNEVIVEYVGYAPGDITVWKAPTLTGPWQPITPVYNAANGSSRFNSTDVAYYRVNYLTLIPGAYIECLYGVDGYLDEDSGGRVSALENGYGDLVNDLALEVSNRASGDNTIRGGATASGDTLKKLEDQITALNSIANVPSEYPIAAALAFNINHNRGFKPEVILLNAAGREVYANVDHLPGNNTVTLTFAVPFTGTAVIK